MVTKQKFPARGKRQRRRSSSTHAAIREKRKKTRRYVYYFGDGHADGSGTMKPLLGGKGANLHEMTRIGLPVPPGFTITTELCSYFYDHNRSYPSQLEAEVAAALAKVEKSVGKKLADKERPLLVSVRSGARDSMPGMMDTILNLGMNDEVVEIVAKKTNNSRFAYDSYRRFLQMYGDVVMGGQKRAGEDHEPFEAVIEHLKDERYGKHDFPDVRLTVADLKELVQRFKALIEERAGKSFPQDPNEQLWGAIGAVFGSWMNDRAIVYRRRYGIPHEWGTAVNIQTMVFGNMGETSATGVAFTRDPATGEKVFYGEHLINAQGEDVVAGVRTPHPIADLAKEMPAAHQELMKVRSILARIETSPEDLRGMIAAEGILTSRGGVSSHAALVARQMGKVCVCGASEIQIDYQKRMLRADGTALAQGDYISIDGTAGEVFAGQVATAPSEIVQVLIDRSLDAKKSETYREYSKLMKWADEFRALGIRTNADTPEQVTNAIAFGAEGVGLCRTEHMFFEGDRIDAMREMILAGTKEERARAVAKLLPYQRGDFIGIFTALKGLPTTIRFLDPPLHEFLPSDHAQQNELANKLSVAVEQIARRVHELHEFNPMLGHRGCRLGIVYPEISEMQARAIFEAAADVQAKGIKVLPEIMIPLVGFPRELKLQIDIVRRVADEVAKEKETKFNYLVGTMIEIPRAALVADLIARDAEFFSFGTNDLTQTTLGMSRDDSGSFLPVYAELDIVDTNPFASIDQQGVGRLMEITRDLGRKTRPHIKLGICGEHGGEPMSVKFCHRLGLDYVSCSPFRIPIARLAAAQAALES